MLNFSTLSREPRSETSSVSPPLGKMRRCAASLVVLAASVLPCALRAQVAGEFMSDHGARDLVASIRDEQQRNGPYSIGLLAPLSSLVLWYEDNDEPTLADAVIEQALLVVRANFGLYSLEQAPLLWRRIRHEEERGNFGLAWDLEQELLELVERNPADLRGVPILRETGDRRLAVLERYLRGEFPPQLVLGCYYNPARLTAGSCTSGSQRKAVKAMLADAQHRYREAVEVLGRNDRYSSGELRELELAIVRASYRQGNYSAGRQSLQRTIEYAVATDEPRQRVRELAAQVGDWDLMFDEPAQALREYQEVVREFGEEGLEGAERDALFAPDIPIVLPTFLPNPLLSNPAAGSRGHIDVGFEISRFGRSSRVRVLDTTTYPSATARDALARVVSESRFRPRLMGGEFVDTRVIVRYYPPE